MFITNFTGFGVTWKAFSPSLTRNRCLACWWTHALFTLLKYFSCNSFAGPLPLSTIFDYDLFVSLRQFFRSAITKFREAIFISFFPIICHPSLTAIQLLCNPFSMYESRTFFHSISICIRSNAANHALSLIIPNDSNHLMNNDFLNSETVKGKNDDTSWTNCGRKQAKKVHKKCSMHVIWWHCFYWKQNRSCWKEKNTERKKRVHLCTASFHHSNHDSLNEWIQSVIQFSRAFL